MKFGAVTTLAMAVLTSSAAVTPLRAELSTALFLERYPDAYWSGGLHCIGQLTQVFVRPHPLQ
jgi:hypothetical protein